MASVAQSPQPFSKGVYSSGLFGTPTNDRFSPVTRYPTFRTSPNRSPAPKLTLDELDVAPTSVTSSVRSPATRGTPRFNYKSAVRHVAAELFASTDPAMSQSIHDPKDLIKNISLQSSLGPAFSNSALVTDSVAELTRQLADAQTTIETLRTEIAARERDWITRSAEQRQEPAARRTPPPPSENAASEPAELAPVSVAESSESNHVSAKVDNQASREDHKTESAADSTLPPSVKPIAAYPDLPPLEDGEHVEESPEEFLEDLQRSYDKFLSTAAELPSEPEPLPKRPSELRSIAPQLAVIFVGAFVLVWMFGWMRGDGPLFEVFWDLFYSIFLQPFGLAEPPYNTMAARGSFPHGQHPR
eukprot:TRINITY_DN18657_c0_g1_i1.p1 TRINITY_DN18657_c0_g1~~TRINITY_DN18657_c0_g1_i1.p1  ORF type:complete len:359 (+),score=24.73 TRINITY_DN18657_c0_g1_i1:31-1107(+)